MFGEQGLGEPRHALGPGQVGVGHEPTQAAIPDGIPRQQHEVWTALPLTDPAQVLLHDRPMTRQSRTLRTWARGHAFDRPCGTNREPLAPRVGGSTWTSAAHWPAIRNHDPEWIGNGSVEQFNFQPDDWVEPCFLRGSREAHHPVQAEVIGERQPGQAEFDRTLNEVLDRGRPVKERKVGVAVELRVRELSHGHWSRVSGGQMEGNNRTSVRSRESPAIAQQLGPRRRQKAVGTDLRSFRSLAVVLTRTVAMIAIVSLLILVLLPAALAAQPGA